MFNCLFKTRKKAFFLITIISILLFSYGEGYAQVFVSNTLNIKLSREIIIKENMEDFLSSLTEDLKKDLQSQDKNLEIYILKIFSEEDPASQLTLWYKIRFISETILDLDDIKNKLLENYEYIMNVEKEYITKSRIIPNDFGIGHLSYDYYALIGAYEAWDMEKGSENVIVAIIDSGVQVNHPDLVNRFVNQSLFKRYPPDTSINPADPTEECYLYKEQIYCFDIYIDSEELDNGALPPDHDVRDVVPHGTPIAGIIAANHNTIGVPGICPNCKLLPIKASYLENLVEQTGQIDPFTEGTSTVGTISSAIEYAAKNGADVINLSMSTSKKSDLLEDSINEACEQYRCIIVAPADNDDEEGKAYPAAFNNVIGLTAVKVNSQNKIVRRNNAQYGTWIDVVSPGQDILSLMLNTNDLKRYSGTSLAVPFVSGLAALVRSRDSNFTVYNFRQLLRESSTGIDDPLYDEKKLGYGLINLKRALDILDDHLWDYSSINQQGNTSPSGDSGGATFWPYNPFLINPYGNNPYGGFSGFGLPVYSNFPVFFGNTYNPYYQQTFYPGGYILPGGQYAQGFQQPYTSSRFLFPIQYGQGYSQPYSTFFLPGQHSQPGYQIVSPYSQFNPVFQQYYPYSTFAGIPSFFGGFGISPFSGRYLFLRFR